MDRPEWVDRATPVDAVQIDVGFLVTQTFYYGPENGFSQEQWQRLREPLYQPQVELYGDYVLSATLDPSAAELVRYYQDVLRLVALHGKKIGQQTHYFWIRPLIFARGTFAITFPWYDTWEESARLLDALATPHEGQLFHDADQGWEFQAYAEAERLFFRQSDPDSDEEHFVIATNRASVAAQVPVVRQRVIRELQELSATIGQDFWSRRYQQR